MKQQITREKAYQIIVNNKQKKMNDEQKIMYCLDWIGFNERNKNYLNLIYKMKEVCLNDRTGGNELLLDLLKCAIMYQLIGTSNTYLELLLDNKYQIDGNEEAMGECECCHYFSIIDDDINEVCPICGWSHEKRNRGNVFLKMAQKRFEENGHIYETLSNSQLSMNAIKYKKKNL